MSRVLIKTRYMYTVHMILTTGDINAHTMYIYTHLQFVKEQLGINLLNIVCKKVKVIHEHKRLTVHFYILLFHWLSITAMNTVFIPSPRHGNYLDCPL